MRSDPTAPQVAYAALIFAVNVEWPGQSIGTFRSRGNERSEIVFPPGSARTSIRVSERDGAFFPSSARWS